ncbi:MAG: choice-of-anchor J domain-containing protein [Bacteroidia bacterium]
MKKILLAISFFTAFGAFSELSGQIIYSEDFDGIPGPTAGGAGTYTMAPGMLLRNVDNRTPNTAVAYVNEAWERREDFTFNIADSCAFSTSWYTPAGAANDFMWTPVIGPLPANSVLSWNGVAYDPAYPDGYEVRIMTVAPTGGTGVIGNQLTNSTVIFTTAAEASAWTTHTVNLSAYSGQSVYVGFRNTSNDKFLLAIDDIIVQVQVNFDAQLLSVDTMQYTIEPQSQRTPNTINGVVRNNGSSAMSNVQLTLTVFDGTMAQIYTNASPVLASLAASTTATLTVGSYTPPSTPDLYTYIYAVSSSSTDQFPGNNSFTRTVLVDDSIYARDDGNVVGSLGIGAGNGGYLGQQFEVVSSANPMTSISYYMARGYTGQRTAAVVWDMNAGEPNVIVAYSDTILYPDDSARLYTVMIDGGPMSLAPGQYAVTAIEFDSTLALAQTNTIFLPGKTWVDWPTSPITGWANNEDFGPSFSKPYVIRPNFGDACVGVSSAATSTDATCGACTDGSATVTVTGGGIFTYSWAPSGGTNATATNLGMGTYTVTATNSFGCITIATVTVGNNCTSFGSSASTVSASCGICNDGSATVNTTNGSGPFTYLWSNGDITMTADSLLPGVYTVIVTDAAGCSSSNSVTVTFATATLTLGQSGSVGLFPNPSEGNVTVFVTLPVATDVTIEVINSLGQLVFASTQLNYSGGQLPLVIETAGLYTVKISTADALRTIPVLINN